MTFLEELRRRNVLRVGSAYVVGAWLAAQVAEFLTETFAAPLWVLQSIVVFLSAALVPVLVFTWMFEFTAQGLRRQAELDRAGVVSSRAGRKFDYLVAVLLVAAAGWFAYSWSARMRAHEEAVAATPAPAAPVAAPVAESNSIAVLPFLDLSRSGDSDVLADGLAEELLGVLGRNRALRVTARSSAFQFKGKQADLRDVGRQLGVRYVLEGSVRLAGERVRIGAQLIDATSGLQLWSETYDRTLSDLFALQDEITAEVAKTLDLVVGAASDTTAARRTASVEAHMELLRALQLGASRAVKDLDGAIGHLERAIVLDPGYAAAHVELAYAQFTRALQLGEDGAIGPLVAPLLARALAIEPRMGEALLLRSALLVTDPAASEQGMRDALALVPSYARGYEMLAGTVAGDFRRTDEAMALLDRAIALDPLSPRNYQVKGMLLADRGDYDGSKRHLLRAVELEPRFRMALAMLAMNGMSRGMFADAVVYGERARALDPESPMLRTSLLHHYLNIGDVDAARRLNVPESPRATLEILLFEGNIDAAMARIRSASGPGQHRGGLSVVAIVALRDSRAHGNAHENLELVQQELEFTGEVPEDLDAFGFNHALLAALLREAGETARADALAAQLDARIDEMLARSAPWTQAPYSWTRAMLLAQRGRNDEALDALERAFNPARPYWWGLLDGNPVFDGLRAHPRYVALRARLQTHLDGQRAALAALRSAGTGAAAGTVAPAG